jgi:hypothetical protein
MCCPSPMNTSLRSKNKDSRASSHEIVFRSSDISMCGFLYRIYINVLIWNIIHLYHIYSFKSVIHSYHIYSFKSVIHSYHIYSFVLSYVYTTYSFWMSYMYIIYIHVKCHACNVFSHYVLFLVHSVRRRLKTDFCSLPFYCFND